MESDILNVLKFEVGNILLPRRFWGRSQTKSIWSAIPILVCQNESISKFYVPFTFCFLGCSSDLPKKTTIRYFHLWDLLHFNNKVCFRSNTRCLCTSLSDPLCCDSYCSILASSWSSWVATFVSWACWTTVCFASCRHLLQPRWCLLQGWPLIHTPIPGYDIDLLDPNHSCLIGYQTPPTHFVMYGCRARRCRR